MKTFAILAAGLATAAAQSDYNSTEIAEIFINLGSLDHNPETVDCDRYTKLFAPNGVLHTPGVPDTFGQDDIAAACNRSHATINPLISFQELNVQITSWNGQTRTAFRWTINGVRTKDGNDVSAPAVTVFFQDNNFSIIDAFSFYDSNMIDGDGTPLPIPAEASDLAEQFIRFGSVNPVPVGVHCSAFAGLFADNGTLHLPGLPDYTGADSIEKACQTAVTGFHVLVPTIQRLIPVSTWNYEHKLAIQFTMAGETASTPSTGAIIPGIATLFTDTDYKILDAWMFFEQSLWPGPVGKATA